MNSLEEFLAGFAIDWFYVIESAGGSIAQYIETYHLRHLDRTALYGREGGAAESLVHLAERMRAGSSESGGLVLAVVDPLDDVEGMQRACDLLPDGLKVVVFAGKHFESRSARMFVQGVPAVDSEQFRAKVGGHIARIVGWQPEGSSLVPARHAFPTTHIDYAGLDRYSPLIGTRHTVRIDNAGVQYDMFSDLRPGSRKLVVFGQSAFGDRAAIELPVFHRWTWLADLEGSALVLNDPTLYLDAGLCGGWWLGTPERDYVIDVIPIIARAAGALGLSSRDVVFYGGSLGGFSSLQMAACMPGSRAVVDNPQIDLRKYSMRSAVDEAARVGLGYSSIDAVGPVHVPRIDVIERFKERKHVPNFLYLQNIRDAGHIAAHFGDFAARLSVLYRDHDWAQGTGEFRTYSALSLTRGGHFPLGRYDTMRYINEFIARDLSSDGSPGARKSVSHRP